MIEFLSINEYSKLSDLARKVNLDEKINFKSVFLCAKNNNGDLDGAAGVALGNIPKFNHIIVTKKFQGGRLAFKLMRAVEKYLRELGYTYYTAFIRRDNKRMIRYAEKFGFKKYLEKKEADWYAKELGD